MGDNLNAITAFDAALSVNQTDTHALDNLAAIFNTLGDRHQALKNLDIALQIDPNDMHKREYFVFGAVSKTQLDAQRSIKMLSYGLIDPRPLVEEIKPLSDIENAIKRAAEPDSYRVIIEPWE